MLKQALIDGLLGSGLKVLDAGQIPTPAAYFAHREWATDAVFIVTGSHNPVEYNGLKFMLGRLPPTEAEIAELRRSAENVTPRRATAQAEGICVVPRYQEWMLRRWAHLSDHRMDIVLDAGGGAFSEIAPAVFESLGFRPRRLFCEIDGAFPHRPPDCARVANLMALRQEVSRWDAQLGIAWDGDGDRVAFVDDAGCAVSPDEVAILLARHFLRPGAAEKVVYDLKLSEAFPRTVVELGGVPIMERSGHAFIKRRAIQEDCLLGCEVSGHYFFRELDGGDDGLFAALLMTELVSRNGPLHELRKGLPEMCLTPDLRLAADRLSPVAVLERLRAALPVIRETTLDGSRLETAEGVVLIRSSITEPVITMRVEGFRKAGLDRILGICLSVLPELLPQIEEQIRQMEHL